MNGIWIVYGSSGSSPQYQIVQDDDAQTPYDLTGASLRVDYWDAAHTGAWDGSQTDGYPFQTPGTYGTRDGEEPQPLLTGTSTDGSVVVDDATNGTLHLVLTSTQCRQLFQRSWNDIRAPRRIGIRIWRTDAGQNLQLFEMIEQARG